MPNFEGEKAPSPHHLQPEVARGDGRSLPNPARRERSLGNSLLQSNSLPACMRAFVRNVHEVRVPHARTRRSAFPPCRPVPPHPLEEKKAFCTTWDEEQGSGGREDDPAGRMVHLGAAVD